MQEAPVVTACAQCVGSNCAQATCNLGCDYGGSGPGQWCNTIVSGLLAGNPKGKKMFTAVFGMPLRKVCDEWKALGIEDGDILTHVNGTYLKDFDLIAKLTLDMPAGTEIAVRKTDDSRLVVRLP